MPAAGNLLHAWLLFAVIAAGVAGLLAVFVALARLPGAAFLPSAQGFYTLLVGHVAFSLIVWLLSSVVVTALYTAMPGPDGVLLSGWGGLWMAVTGSAILLAVSVAGRGQPILSDYLPVLDAPAFLSGYALFGAGVALSLGGLWRNAAKRREQPLPLPFYGMLCVSATFGVTVLALILGIFTVAPRVYQPMFWGAGHALQYVYAGTMAMVWYLLAASLAATPPAPRLSRLAFVLYPILALPAAFIYVVFDPVSIPASRAISVILGAGVSVPTVIHLVLVGVAIFRERHQRRGSWSAVWRRPEMVALVASVGFYLLGGLLAPVGSQGTLRVTAHYHAILVGGATMGFMGLAYRLMVVMGWGAVSRRLAVAQLYLFGTGVLSTVLILGWAGALGAPRKMYGGALQGAAWAGAMSLMALAAGLATLGGTLFVGIVLSSLLRMQPTTRPRRAIEAVPVESSLP